MDKQVTDRHDPQAKFAASSVSDQRSIQSCTTAPGSVRIRSQAADSPETVEVARQAIIDGDYANALKICFALADQEDDVAQNCLGYLYHNGKGVEQDDDEALKWYRLAAEKGNVKAWNNLGIMYHNGYGVPADQDEALKWYRRAAEQDLAGAQRNLGLYYEFNPEGHRIDLDEAMKWYRLAAGQGDSGAQNSIGNMYFHGQGVVEDRIEAIRWYRLAADQGYAYSQQNLGFVHYNGEGVPKNLEKAFNWFRLAALQGDNKSQFMIGRMHVDGKHLPRDYPLAYAWMSLAEERGSKCDGELAILDALMTDDAVAEAKALARNWKEGSDLVPTRRHGMTFIQRSLMRLGYHLPGVNGERKPQTMTAIRNFMDDHDLDSDRTTTAQLERVLHDEVTNRD